MAKHVFGIDLGTTYSCIAYVDDTARVVQLENSEGESTTASVVGFDGNDIIVGSLAKEEAVIRPKATVQLVKTIMGKTDIAINYNGENKTPEEISAYILKKLAQDASKQLGEEVKDVVITCPAYFGTAERTATKNAGKIAGLNVLEIISEPTAAALYYGCAKEQDEKTILVYDLGGGTFDVTIMKISSERIEVVCSDGEHNLGGKDWDEAIIYYLTEQIKEKNGEDTEIDEHIQQDLILKAEIMKKQLTSKDRTNTMIDINGNKIRVSLNREQFEDLTSTLLETTLIKTEEVIKIAKGKIPNLKIDEILLVGGSTRMPQVTEALSKKYNDIEIKVLEPDLAVAKGAAIHAVNVYVHNQKSLEENREESKDLNAEDYKEKLEVTPEMLSIGGKEKKIIIATTKSFAVKVLRGLRKEIKCYNMIIKNEKMVDGFIEVKEDFTPSEDNQEYIDIEIYENDYIDEYFEVEEDLKIGNAVLELPPKFPSTSPITVILKLNNEGILEVTGLEKSANKKVNVKLVTQGIMSEDELEKLTEKISSIQVMS